MTEITFCCLLFASFIFAERASKSENWLPAAALAGLLAGAAYLTRSVAIILLVSGPLCFLFRRQRKQAAVFAIGMAPFLLGWSVWTHAHAQITRDLSSLSGTSYLEYYFRMLLGSSWQDLALIFYRNLESFLSSTISLLLLQVSNSLVARFFWLLIAMTAIFGAIRTGRVALTHYHTFAAGYLAVMLVWNGVTTTRYVVPNLPLLLVGISTEVVKLFRVMSRWLRSNQLSLLCAGWLTFATLAISSAMVLMAVLVGIWLSWWGVFGDQRTQLAQSRKAYSWVSHNVPSNVKFLAYDDAKLYLYTGNKARGIYVPPLLLMYRRDRDGVLRVLRSLDKFARENHLEYFFLQSGDLGRELSTGWRLKAIDSLRTNPGFHSVYASGEVTIFRVE